MIVVVDFVLIGLNVHDHTKIRMLGR
jgi:hypothetical protein